MKTTVFFAALALSATAMAQDTRTPSSSTGTSAGTQSSATFEALDTNSDGRISASEAQASPSLASKFSMLDKQNRGYITRDEYQSYQRSSSGPSSSSDTSSSSTTSPSDSSSSSPSTTPER